MKPGDTQDCTILPCPFCGGAVTTVIVNDEPRAWGVFCESTGCRVRPSTYADHDEATVIAAWNQRPQQLSETACAKLVREFVARLEPLADDIAEAAPYDSRWEDVDSILRVALANARSAS